MSDKKPTDPALSEKRREAGKKGGATTRDRHGKEYFVKIGALGGSAPHSTPQATGQETDSDESPIG
ncbi:MAG: hypothetical protein ACOYYS_10615 [Chloroflexota bacterium]